MESQSVCYLAQVCTKDGLITSVTPVDDLPNTTAPIPPSEFLWPPVEDVTDVSSWKGVLIDTYRAFVGAGGLDDTDLLDPERSFITRQHADAVAEYPNAKASDVLLLARHRALLDFERLLVLSRRETVVTGPAERTLIIKNHRSHITTLLRIMRDAGVLADLEPFA